MYRYLIFICVVSGLTLLGCGDSTSGSSKSGDRQVIASDLDNCYAELDKLNQSSRPESCSRAGVSTFTVSGVLQTGSKAGSVSGNFFIEKSGQLELTCGDCNLSKLRIFGPGTVTVNGYTCQKKKGQVNCPPEALKAKPEEQPRKLDLQKELTGSWHQKCTSASINHSFSIDAKSKDEMKSQSAESTLNFLSESHFKYVFKVYPSGNCYGTSWEYSYSGTYKIKPVKDEIELSIVRSEVKTNSGDYEMDQFFKEGSIKISGIDSNSAGFDLTWSYMNYVKSSTTIGFRGSQYFKQSL